MSLAQSSVCRPSPKYTIHIILMRRQLQGTGNACKSCNYTAPTEEVRPNYTPVEHLEVTRRQVEPAACLRNTPENVRNDKRAGDRNGSTEAFSRGLRGSGR